MILTVRNYLLTLIVFVAGLAWRLPPIVLLGSLAAAWLIDTFVTSQSPELTLFRRKARLDAPVPRRMGIVQALMLQFAAAAGGTAIVFATAVMTNNETANQLSRVMAVLLVGFSVSFCGLSIVVTHRHSVQDLEILYATLYGILAYVRLFKIQHQLILAGTIRIIVGSVGSVVSIVILDNLGTPHPGNGFLVVVALALFIMQTGVIGIVVGLFNLMSARR